MVASTKSTGMVLKSWHGCWRGVLTGDLLEYLLSWLGIICVKPALICLCSSLWFPDLRNAFEIFSPRHRCTERCPTDIQILLGPCSTSLEECHRDGYNNAPRAEDQCQIVGIPPQVLPCRLRAFYVSDRRYALQRLRSCQFTPKVKLSRILSCGSFNLSYSRHH
jgi:hypothetical protein